MKPEPSILEPVIQKRAHTVYEVEKDNWSNWMKPRTLHRSTAPFLFLPLFFSAITGIAYRIGRSWFQIPDQIADTLMVIHEGAYLGAPLVPIYVLLVGLGLLALLVTGSSMLVQSKATRKQRFTGRSIHHQVAFIACFPLLLTALTGMAYRLGKNWFGLPAEKAKILLNIHQGTYLGTNLRPFYILFLGLGLLVLLITGINMTSILRRRNQMTN